MLISTQFFRFCKGLEHFYYAMLFAADPYAAGPAPWLSWLQIGFNVGAREAPPAAAPGDALRVDTRPGRTFEFRAASGNRQVLEKLRGLMVELDRVRASLGAKTEAERLK